MSSFYRAKVSEFLLQSDEQILARLQTGYARQGYTSQYTDQTLTWIRDIELLRDALQKCLAESQSAGSWAMILEYSIPRKEKRIDLVLLVRDAIVVMEAKSGQTGAQAEKQLEEYALLLHYFHKASDGHRIIPILVSPTERQPDLTILNQREFFPQLPTYWVAPVVQSNWSRLAALLLEVEKHASGQIDLDEWSTSSYFPVPTIIEAAIALKSGLSIREIAHSEASEHEIADVRQTIQTYVDKARAEAQHAICFLTGVPGSGKTLVGLSLAHSGENKAEAIHFMSGNGPLVSVLQQLFKRESMRKGASAVQALTESKTLIENVHEFARYYTKDNLGAPHDHAIIFDEAQRAWNRAQHMKKFKRDYSEPEMLLKIMERHQDWAMVVALVGGGQEINDGEAGLEEWGRALIDAQKDWRIYASPEVLNGGPSTAGHRLFADSVESRTIETSSALHLRTSNRSLRADQLATWVNYVLEGKAASAAELLIAERFPMFLSRSLDQTRLKLREQGRGDNRYGLVGSSAAARLRADGLEPSASFHANYQWEHWYLAGENDVRSSYRCEVFATEFEIQGLELDWVGLCWGGDLIWRQSGGWSVRALRHGYQSKWSPIKNADKKIYRKNAYRVLLTRARKGMIIYIPPGNAEDLTCNPDEFNATAQYLLRCGVTPLG